MSIADVTMKLAPPRASGGAVGDTCVAGTPGLIFFIGGIFLRVFLFGGNLSVCFCDFFVWGLSLFVF